MDFYHQQIDREAFGHTGLGLGGLYALPSKDTMRVIDEIVARLVADEQSCNHQGYYGA